MVDSGSTDRTVEIAREPRRARDRGALARLCGAEELGRGSSAQNEWISRSTPTKRSREALEAEICGSRKPRPAVRRLYDAPAGPISGPLDLHTGWYPDRKVRLYDRTRAKWIGDLRA